uniref:Uncharacterized protein n=1 Tax=Arundo donax TaxID=35708 RepID=A0A0A9E4J4_ARUDO
MHGETLWEGSGFSVLIIINTENYCNCTVVIDLIHQFSIQSNGPHPLHWHEANAEDPVLVTD